MFFKKKVKKSFKKAKKDMNTVKQYCEALNFEQQTLKKSAHDWIIFLARENSALKARIEKLEQQTYAHECACEHQIIH